MTEAPEKQFLLFFSNFLIVKIFQIRGGRGTGRLADRQPGRQPGRQADSQIDRTERDRQFKRLERIKRIENKL